MLVILELILNDRDQHHVILVNVIQMLNVFCLYNWRGASVGRKVQQQQHM
jgi:hypothetical protein